MKPLTGEELKEAIENKTSIRYWLRYNDPMESDIDMIVTPSLASDGYVELDPDPETGFELEMLDVYADASMSWEVDGLEGLYPGDKGTAEDQKLYSLAKFLHEDVWAHWMKHFFETCGVYIDSPDHEHFGTGKILTIYAGKEQRWKRQMNTAYEDLEDAEKESDRDLAEKLMKLLEEQQW